VWRLDLPDEERFDRVTRLATRLLGAPISLISLVTENIQWFKSAQGLKDSELERKTSFCGHAIMGEETFVVEDAGKDGRFFDNPLVTGEPRIRFYAGHPLHAEDGSRVGTLCVIDRAPRKLSAEELEILRDLAAIAESELQHGLLTETQRQLVAKLEDLERKALVDAVTRLWNRGAIIELLRGELVRAQGGSPLALALIELDHWKDIGREAGAAADAVLTEAGLRLRQSIRAFDMVGRYGDASFLVMLSGCKPGKARALADGMRAGLAATPMATSARRHVTASIGLASYNGRYSDPAVMIGAAEAALFRAIKAGGNRVEMETPKEGSGLLSQLFSTRELPPQTRRSPKQ